MKLHVHFVYCLAMSCFPLMAIGAPIVNAEDLTMGSIEMSEFSLNPGLITREYRSQKQEVRTMRRTEKQMERIEKYFQSRMEKKSLGNINDPVDKWFWFWGISWGLGILISIFTAGAVVGTGIGLLWWLLFAIGSVSLVIWLVKKFG